MKGLPFQSKKVCKSAFKGLELEGGASMSGTLLSTLGTI